jgi:O-antigen ligase
MPISGTIALKNILISALIVVLLASFFKNRLYRELKNYDKKLIIIIFALFIFLLYALLHSFYLSENPEWSLRHYRGHLFYPTVYFLTGMLLANFVSNSKKISARTVITVLFLSMFIHVLYIDLVAFDRLWNSGVMTRRYGGLIQHITAANYVTNILLAIIVSEFLYRFRVKIKILPFSNGVLYLLLALCVFSAFVEALRLGDIILVFLGIGSAVIFLYKNNLHSRWARNTIAVGLFVILSVPLAYNIHSDPRWSKLIETIPLAVDTSNSKHWLDKKFEAPKTKSGYTVSGSNYERIAWAAKSLEYIYEDPIGIGYSKNALGRAFDKRYKGGANEKYSGANAHSAILTLALGIGIPGVLLWFLFVYFVLKESVANLKKSYGYFSILSLFIITGLFSRSFVDENMIDHIFQQYMLILGISLLFMIKEKNIEYKQSE